MKRNYQRELDAVLSGITAEGGRPRLLLHSCCAPCSTYVLEYLAQYFDITLLYYNPNIYPEAEYNRRAGEQVRLPGLMALPASVDVLVAPYDPAEFDAAVSGLEDAPEGGARCARCFRLRLEEAARAAVQTGCDYFTTTLSVSPHKDAALLASIGGELAAQYGVRHLYADFKKRDGYKRSVTLAKAYGLYRQDYCGCKYSMRGQSGDAPKEKS